ncbi:MAG: branched-chain amino acid ABC transporter permease [Candidatus Methanomethylicia archaeon]
MFTEILIPLLFNTLLFFSILVSITLGLSLIFGVLGILNLAHGAFYTLGAYIAILLFSYFTNASPILYYILLFTASLIVGVIGMWIEPTLLRSVYKLPDEYQLLLTFSLSLIILDIIRYFFGVMPYYHYEFFAMLGSSEVAEVVYPNYYVIAIVTVLLLLLLLYFLLFKTKIGLLIRAASMDKEMAISLGINIKTLYPLVFALGIFLCAMGGALITPYSAITLGVGSEITTIAFAITAMGGLGSLKGALLGSLIVGFVRALGVFYFPEIELVVIYILMFIILSIRPYGLCGKYERRV